MDIEPSNLLDNLKNTLVKENNQISSFITELKEFIKNIEEKGFIEAIKEKLEKSMETGKNKRNEVSLIEQTLENEIVTVRCRDKMYASRGNILKNCFEETSEKGTLYYIYSKDSQKEGVYNICADGDEIREYSGEILESELPEGAGVDSVLRLVDGEYILDVEATEYVREEMEKAIAELLEEQEQLLESYRVEGHIYEVVEVCGEHDVWLNDVTLQTSTCFQETNIPSLVLENITARSLVQYVNGEYILY